MKQGLWLLVVLLLAGCAIPDIVPTPTAAPITGTPEPLRLVCTEALLPLGRALGSAYQRENPTVQVVLVERADALAWQMLEQQETDVALLTWLPAERSERVWIAPVARDGLAVVVNPQNGVPGLTMDQLRELFLGRVEDWASWGGLPGVPQLISREEASGDYTFFQAQVMGDFPVALTAFLAPTSDGVLNLVRDDQSAVGYVSHARVDDRVRAIAIEGAPPAPDAIAAGLYPLSRELFLAADETPQGAARDFVQWVLGPTGQQTVSAQGWLPARSE